MPTVPAQVVRARISATPVQREVQVCKTVPNPEDGPAYEIETQPYQPMAIQKEAQSQLI